MSDRADHRDRLRALEFDAFVAGAGGRLLHTATLLTGEPPQPPGAYPRAEHLLHAALSRTYAEWDRLHGGDPYDLSRRELALRFAREAQEFVRAAELARHAGYDGVEIMGSEGYLINEFI
ncbi:oxidoreductase, partial [Streptomyces californicus]